jgi:hypothetical protein
MAKSALVDAEHHRVQPERPTTRQLRCDLVLRADVARQRPDHLRPATQLGMQRAHVRHRKGQVLVVVTGPVGVRHR